MSFWKDRKSSGQRRFSSYSESVNVDIISISLCVEHPTYYTYFSKIKSRQLVRLTGIITLIFKVKRWWLYVIFCVYKLSFLAVPISEVWTDIVAEGYVRSTSSRSHTVCYLLPCTSWLHLSYIQLFAVQQVFQLSIIFLDIESNRVWKLCPD